MSPPTKELMKLTLEQKLAHGGHPVLLSTMTEAFCLSKGKMMITLLLLGLIVLREGINQGIGGFDEYT